METASPALSSSFPSPSPFPYPPAGTDADVPPAFHDMVASVPDQALCRTRGAIPLGRLPALLAVLVHRWRALPQPRIAVADAGGLRILALEVTAGARLGDLVPEDPVPDAADGPADALVISEPAGDLPAVALVLRVEADGRLRVILDRRLCRPPFDEARASDLAHALDRLIAAGPDAAQGAVDLISPARRYELLIERNGPRRPCPTAPAIPDAIRAIARRDPQRVALVHEAARLTYGELDARADRLAAMLAARGVGRGDMLPLLMPNGLELPLAMLAAMKLGAPFVPMDDGWAPERVTALLEALAPRLVIAADPAVVPPGVAALILDHAAIPPAETPFDAVAVDGRDPIYGFYTSGTTGLPKCAINLHGGLLNRFGVMTRRFAADGRPPVVLQNSRHVFDSSIWQLLWPLTIGGRVIIPRTRGVLDLETTLRTIAAHDIEMTDFVPSIFNAMVDLMVTEPGLVRRLGSLRHLLIGGEEIDPRAVRRFRRMLPGIGIVNTYGPTEASIGMVFHHVGDDDDRSIPIGTPIDNTVAVVVDDHGFIAPPGMVGEIRIGGACLGGGYLGAPEKTAAAHVDNPFPELPGDRLYRTGDLGYWRRDGRLAYVGRRDDQVKIGGVRIELGEIEGALADHPDIRAGRVVVHEQGGRRELVACLIGHGEVDTADLRRFLATRLPRQALPARLLVLDALPLNANGKVDRRALARLATDRLEAAAAADAGFTDPTCAALAARWRATLQLAPAGPEDGFFDLGGTSLTALVLAMDLTRHFGLRITVADIFARPTLGALAALIDRRRRGEETASAPVPAPEVRLADDIRPPAGAAAWAPPAGRVRVLLTGATGFVGAHLLPALLARPDVDLVCLVRAEDDAAAALRLGIAADRVIVLAGDLALPQLGLGDAAWRRLAEGVDVIVNAGALVNLLHGYEAHAAANVTGVETLLRLAVTGVPKHLHQVSTLSIFARSPGHDAVTEADAADPRALPQDGYSRSKWAAERLIDEARRRGITASLHRLGEMLPARRSGLGNPQALVERLTATCLRLGLRFPTGLRFDYSPVDIAAAFVAARLTEPAATFHLYGPGTRFEDLLDEAEAAGIALTPVSYAAFHERLSRAAAGDVDAAALLALLPDPAGDDGADAFATADLVADKDLMFGDAASRAAMAAAGLAWPAVDAGLLAPWFARRRAACPPSCDESASEETA